MRARCAGKMPLCSNINTRHPPCHSGVARGCLARAAIVLLAVASELPKASSSSPPSSSSAPRGGGRGRTQRVSISAPWPTSCLSPLAEAAEFVAESGDPSLFWNYVEAVGDAPTWLFACAASGENSDDDGSGGSGSGGDDGREGVAVGALLEGAVAVAVRAAGQGFGGEHGGAAEARQGRRSTGMRIDDLSQRLMELALSTRYGYDDDDGGWLFERQGRRLQGRCAGRVEICGWIEAGVGGCVLVPSCSTATATAAEAEAEAAVAVVAAAKLVLVM